MIKRPLFLAAGLLIPGIACGQASPYRGLWVGEVRLNGVNEVSIPLDAQNIPRAPNPAVTTKTFDAANLRLILHVNGAGQVSLLKQVAILNRKAGAAKSENDLALVTDERLYGSFPPQPAQRIASVVFDFGDTKTTRAVDAVVEAAAVRAAALIGSGQTQTDAQAGALTAAAGVIAAADTAERYATFLRDTMNTAAVTALSTSGQATAAQDTAAAALKSGSFYADTRGEEMIAALEAAIAAMPDADAAAKKAAAQNIAAGYADTGNLYQRFIAGELIGNALSASAQAAAQAAAGIQQKAVTQYAGTPGTAPLEITTANHGLTTGDRISLGGAPVAAYNGIHQVTRVDANRFTLSGVVPVGGKSVASYAASENLSPVTINAAGHGLSSGTRIVITGADTAGYNGTHYITKISEDAFSIPVAFAGNTGAKGFWVEKSGSITGYASATGGGSSLKVNAPGHLLNNGDRIVISGAGTAAYNGTHAITRIDADSFSIPVPFGGNPSAKGSWSVQNTIGGYAEPAERTTTISSAAHGLETGDHIILSGSGNGSYNGTFSIERLDADRFTIPVIFDESTGDPAVKGAWVPALTGVWRSYQAILDAAGSGSKINDARAEALRIKIAAYDDTRGTVAIDTVVRTIAQTAADAGGTAAQIAQAAETAGRAALAELVARSAIPDITPTADYTAFIRSSDARFTDFKEIAPIAAAAAAAGAATEFANVLHTDQTLINKAKEKAIAALTSVYAAAARSQRPELLLSGGFGPGVSGLTGTIVLPANHPTNPFRHRRHPDHSTGFDITRVVTFSFDGAAGDTLTSAGFGVDSISGTYAEEIHGLHKPLGPSQDTGLKVSGTFSLQRISLIDALNAR